MDEQLLKALKEELETFAKGVAKQPDMDKLRDDLEEMGIKLQKMSDGTSTGSNLSLKDRLETLIKGNKDNIENVRRHKGSEVSLFTIKADTVRASVTNSTIAFDAAGVGQLQFQTPLVADLFNKVTVPENMGGVVRYMDWDDGTSVRAAAMRAENTLFPESTAAWEESKIAIEKLTDSIPVTEEFMYDFALLANELRSFLSTNIALLEDVQLVTGDNVAPNLYGLLTYAAEYAAPQIGLVEANLGDLILKMVEDITTATNYKPDFVLMNPADFVGQMLLKIADGRYIAAPWWDSGAMTVAGLQIVLTSTVSANSLIIGEKTRGTIYTDGNVDVSAGWISDDFLKDKIRLRAKMRENLLIKKRDVGAFRKCTDIAAAVATLATTPA